MKGFTRRVRRLRLDRSLTQRVTALRAKIPYGRYMNIENGFRVATPDELERLARVLKTSVQTLQFGPEVLEAPEMAQRAG